MCFKLAVWKPVFVHAVSFKTSREQPFITDSKVSFAKLSEVLWEGYSQADSAEWGWDSGLQLFSFSDLGLALKHLLEEFPFITWLFAVFVIHTNLSVTCCYY